MAAADEVTKIETRVGNPYTLRINVGTSLEGATGLKGYYRTPDGTEASIMGTLVPGSTKIRVPVTAAINATPGEYRFQGAATFLGDTDPSRGDPITVISRDEWASPGL